MPTGYFLSGGQLVSLLLALEGVTVHWTEDPELFAIWDNGTYSTGTIDAVCQLLWCEKDYGLSPENQMRLKTFAAKYGVKLE